MVGAGVGKITGWCWVVGHRAGAMGAYMVGAGVGKIQGWVLGVGS